MVMLNDSIDTAFLHYNRAKKNHNIIRNDNLNREVFLDDNKIKTIDAFNIMEEVRLSVKKYCHNKNLL